MDNWDAFHHPQSPRQQQFSSPPHGPVPTSVQTAHSHPARAHLQYEGAGIQQSENGSFSLLTSRDGYAHANEHHAAEDGGSLVGRLDSWWMGFVSPKDYARRMGLDAKESDRLRRGK